MTVVLVLARPLHCWTAEEAVERSWAFRHLFLSPSSSTPFELVVLQGTRIDPATIVAVIRFDELSVVSGALTLLSRER